MISLLVIVGPTAVGKSETAFIVARDLDCEIISADSRQFYAGLEIGSGAPPKEWRDQIPHHFVSTAPLTHRITAGEFGKSAREIAYDVAGRGKIPLIIGGSGLYVRSLVQGLALAPPSSPEIRQRLQAELKDQGFESLFSELKAVDPQYARLVSATTPKRLIRALEVQRVSGKSLSDWHLESQPAPWCKPLIIGLERARQELREIIDRRVREMIIYGWLKEVKELLSLYSSADNFPPAASEAVGYKLLADVIAGERSLEEATVLIATATKQFAKRQMTWFRADKQTEWLKGFGSDAPKKWATEIAGRWGLFLAVGCPHPTAENHYLSQGEDTLRQR